MKKVLIIVGLLTAAIVTSKAQNYSFKVEVTGKGTPLLMIPGLSSSGEVWNETVDELSKDYECHVVTLPGFAGQPAIETDVYLSTIGDELISYIKSEKLKNTVVMGHSLGGFLTLYIASKEPDLVSKLVVVDGLPFLGAMQNPAATPKSMKEMALMMKNNIEMQSSEQYEAMQPAILKTMITAEANVATAMEWGRQSDKSTVAKAMYELYQLDLREEIAGIRAPTLVLGAWVAYKNYGATRESSMKLYQAQFKNMRDVRVELTDIGKHFIMLDDPEFFFAKVKGFLDEKG